MSAWLSCFFSRFPSVCRSSVADIKPLPPSTATPPPTPAPSSARSRASFSGGTFSVIGESLDYGQIGPPLSAAAYDCQHNNVSVSHFTYATTNMNNRRREPRQRHLLRRFNWNRNTGSGIPDFTICTPPASTPSVYEAFITANANGVSSNAIPIFSFTPTRHRCLSSSVHAAVLQPRAAAAPATPPPIAARPTSPPHPKRLPPATTAPLRLPEPPRADRRQGVRQRGAAT